MAIYYSDFPVIHGWMTDGLTSSNQLQPLQQVSK